MPVPKDAVIQVNFVGSLYSQMTVTTFYYLATNAADQPTADVNNIAQGMYDGFGSVFEDLVSQDWHWDRVEVRDPRTTPVWASGEVTVVGNGTVAIASCPPSVAWVVTRRTDLAGRSNRGRIYMPALPTDWQAEGVITDIQFPTLQAFAADLPDVITFSPDGITPWTFTPVVWSRKLQSYHSMTNAIARKILRSQRRREIGVGK